MSARNACNELVLLKMGWELGELHGVNTDLAPGEGRGGRASAEAVVGWEAGEGREGWTVQGGLVAVSGPAGCC